MSGKIGTGIWPARGDWVQTAWSFLPLLIVLPPTLVLFYLRYPAYFRPSPRRRTAVVLVLGDVGRSPRMMYHADSLGRNGWKVWVVGYKGSKPIPSLLTSPHINLAYIPSPPRILQRLPFILTAPIKIIWQIASIMWVLARVPGRGWFEAGAEIMLVQNPPSIPTLALSQLVAYLRGTKLIIDWHNLGYSILALKVGNNSPITKVAKWFERTFGRFAFAHLFVTQAMHDELVKEWRLVGRKLVLRDRPPKHFRRSGPMTQHELFSRLLPNLSPPLAADFALAPTPSENLFTRFDPSTALVEHQPDRPAFIVSSTSWTPDEDFSILVDALDQYHDNRKAQPDLKLPRLVVLVSGKGPLRDSFRRQVAERETSGRWTDIVLRCVWLEIEDYPRFLGCADLGISLHQSSSGLDLPMKVIDMFGCGVPVLSRQFKCVEELIAVDQTGCLFDNASQLTALLEKLLARFPAATELQRMRDVFPDSHSPDAPGEHSRTATPPPGKSSRKTNATPSHALKTERRRRHVLQRVDSTNPQNAHHEEAPALTVVWETWDDSWDSRLLPILNGQRQI